MATAKHAKVVSIERLGPDSRLVRLACEEPLGFVGGQYVIVDSGLVATNGKAVKRAYSIVSSDAEQGMIELVVLRLADGPGSSYMHEVEVGRTLTFSGPWGKMQLEAEPAQGATVVLATDTGITAALGFLQAQRMRPLLATTELVWLRPEGERFVSPEFVRERLPAQCAQLRIEGIAKPGTPERLERARSVFAELLARRSPIRARICGDGAVNYALLDDACAAGLLCTRDHLESFFNMPKKSAALPAPPALRAPSEGA